MKKLFLLIITTILMSGAFFVSSCSVNYSFTGADIPAEAKTVSVDLFTIEGQAARANPIAGDKFTDALMATMLTQTNLDLVAKNGDLQFSGSIISYTNTPVGMQSDTETSDRNRLKMTVEVIYTNTIEPEKSFKRSFSQFADFESSENLGDVEEDLLTIINETITQDIFNASLGSW